MSKGAKGSRAALPPIDAPLPPVDDGSAVNSSDTDDGSLWSSFQAWIKDLLRRDSETFAQQDDTTSPHEPFTLRQCCNWGNIRTKLFLMAMLDLLASMYGLASANRVRLISPLLNITGLMFTWVLFIGMCITCLGIVGMFQQDSRYIRIFFYWSICALVLNFALSAIDLNSIDQQCDFIWNNFDHSAYAEKDRALFAKQCASYAYCFFSVVMVAMAFARLYYTYLIRRFYISITPEHEGYAATRGGTGAGGRTYGYAPVHSSGGPGAYSSHSSHAHDDNEDYP